MKQEALSYFSDTGWTNAALLLFLLAFAMIVVWALLGTKKSQLEHWSKLPLDEKGE